jgi:hypothetical protein
MYICVYICDEKDDEDCCCPLDPILCWFRLFHTLSGFVGVATAGANGFVIATIDSITMDYRDIIMRSYAVLFCIVIVFVEIDWRCMMRRFRILDLWFFRGLFYFLVGFMTVQGDKTFTQPQDIVGLVQIGVGALYVLMGVLCIKSIKTQRLAIYESKVSRSRPGAEVSYASV